VLWTEFSRGKVCVTGFIVMLNAVVGAVESGSLESIKMLKKFGVRLHHCAGTTITDVVIYLDKDAVEIGSGAYLFVCLCEAPLSQLFRICVFSCRAESGKSPHTVVPHNSYQEH
jgi:hypothetical protein